MNDLDIIFSENKEDFKTENTDIYKADNICSVQLGSLNGGLDIGIDFDQFVRGELEFSIDSFKAHILNQLTILNCRVNRVNIRQNELDGELIIGVE